MNNKKYLLFSFSFVVASACAVSFAAPVDESVASPVSARSAFDSRDYARAYELYGRLATPAPPDDFYRIKCLYELKRYNEFIDEVEKLRLKNPNHPALDDLDFLSFSVYHWLGKKSDEERVVTEFASRYPDSPYLLRLDECRNVMSKDAWFQAKEAFGNRDFVRARKLYLQCSGKEPQFWALKCLYEQKEYDAFAKELSSFKEANPSSPALGDLTILEARSAEEQGQYDEALSILSSHSDVLSSCSATVAELKETISLNKSLGSAVSLVRLDKDYERALPLLADYISDAADLKSKRLAQYYALQCFYHLDPDEFLTRINELKTINPDHPYLDQLVLLQAHVLDAKKRWDEASTLLSDFSEKYPSSRHQKFAQSLENRFSKLSSTGSLAQRDMVGYLDALWDAKSPDKVAGLAEKYLTEHPDAPDAPAVALRLLQAADVTSGTVSNDLLSKASAPLLKGLPSAVRSGQFGESGLSVEFKTKVTDSSFVESFIKDNPEHWRVRKAARELSRRYLTDDKYEKSLSLANQLLATTGTLSKDERNELRFIAAIDTALLGNGEQAKEMLDALVWDNDTRYYYTNQVMLELERMYEQTSKELSLKAGRAIIPLYTYKDREWCSAQAYVATALCYLGYESKDKTQRAQYYKESIPLWQEIMDKCDMDSQFKAYQMSSAGGFLLYMLPVAQKRDLYEKVEKFPPSVERTRVLEEFKQYRKR
ncbi:MAG: hypothetical protein PHX74_06290 [Candidatus Sumerlaeales bacterium]|nr:hypothetical protein [Candidatus Sumerlaeales bacterium]